MQNPSKYIDKFRRGVCILAAPPFIPPKSGPVGVWKNVYFILSTKKLTKKKKYIKWKT